MEIRRSEKKLYSGGISLYKLIILTITFGSFVFADSLDSTYSTIEKSDLVKNQFCLAEDTSKDDFKLERRRRGKGNTKRKRGGNGLR